MKLSRQQGAIGRAREEMNALIGSTRLGSEDKTRLQQHVGFIQDLENRLVAANSGGSGPACTPPARPSSLNSVESNLAAITRNAIDVIVAGLRCDLTRVVHFGLCPGTDTRSDGFFTGGSGGDDHHIISHSLDPVKLGNINAGARVPGRGSVEQAECARSSGCHGNHHHPG